MSIMRTKRTIFALNGIGLAAAVAGLVLTGCSTAAHPSASAGKPNNCAVWQPGCPQTPAQAAALASSAAQASAQASAAASAEASIVDTPTTPPPATSAPPPPPPPTYTVSQQQAIDAAENYLTDGQGFSQAGLIQQLTSSYGNGFSTADATVAVNSLYHPGLWDAQAALSAANYMSDGQGFSCSSLLQQLTSAYGSQFTYQQGEYGVQSVGLGTC
jgi:hypothetical protein